MGFVFITGWTRGSEPGGLTQFSFDYETGRMNHIRTIMEETTFGTVFVNAKKNVIYAINETRDIRGGNIYSFSVDPESGALNLLGIASTFVPNPAYLGIDSTGKYAVVADHSAPSRCVKVERDENGHYHAIMLNNDAIIMMFRIGENGALGEVIDVIKYEGRGIGSRQDMPHPHCTVFSPDGELIAVCDKGTDKVHIYTIDRNNESLKEITEWKEADESMPRYAVFHPFEHFFYHNNENCGRIDAFEYDHSGRFTKIGEFSAIDGLNEKAEQQGLCIHPNGKYLYSALKEPEGISVLQIDESGALKQIQFVSKKYAWLRGIAVSPCGKYLIATYLESGKAVLFRIEDDGKLIDTGEENDVSRAAGIAFM